MVLYCAVPIFCASALLIPALIACKTSARSMSVFGTLSERNSAFATLIILTSFSSWRFTSDKYTPTISEPSFNRHDSVTFGFMYSHCEPLRRSCETCCNCSSIIRNVVLALPFYNLFWVVEPELQLCLWVTAFFYFVSEQLRVFRH